MYVREVVTVARRRKAQSIVTKRRYVVEDFRNPPKRQVQGYRTVRLPGGHLARVAITKNEGPRGGRTRITSLWHPKSERASSNPRVTKALQAARKSARKARKRGGKGRGR